MKNTNHSIINHPIINITGLACQIWTDKASKETKRKRLVQRVQHSTFTPEEKAAILKQIEQLYNSAKIEMSPE